MAVLPSNVGGIPGKKTNKPSTGCSAGLVCDNFVDIDYVVMRTSNADGYINQRCDPFDCADLLEGDVVVPFFAEQSSFPDGKGFYYAFPEFCQQGSFYWRFAIWCVTFCNGGDLDIWIGINQRSYTDFNNPPELSGGFESASIRWQDLIPSADYGVFYTISLQRDDTSAVPCVFDTGLGGTIPDVQVAVFE